MSLLETFLEGTELTEKRQQTVAGKVASEIRKVLKQNKIPAKVRSKNYSGGNSITIDLKNQLPATVEKIKQWANKYKQGYFDSSTDMYVGNPNKKFEETVKFIFVNNDWDEKHEKDAWKYTKMWFTKKQNPTDPYGRPTEEPSDTDMPETMNDYELLRSIMSGKYGKWLTTIKKRVRAFESNINDDSDFLFEEVEPMAEEMELTLDEAYNRKADQGTTGDREYEPRAKGEKKFKDAHKVDEMGWDKDYMKIKESASLVQHAWDENPQDFKDAFDASIKARIGDAIENLKVNMFEPEMEDFEDVES